MQAAHGKCSCSIALALGRDWKGRSRTKNGDSRKDRSLLPWRDGKYRCFHEEPKKESIAVIFALGEIGKSVTWQRLGDVANSTVTLLGETGKIAASQKFEDAALNAEMLLQEIGTGAIEKNLKETADISVRSIQNIGKTADRQGLDKALLQAAYSLETIKFNAEDRYLMNASILAEVALLHFERLEIEKLEDKLNKIFQGEEEISRYRFMNFSSQFNNYWY